MDDQKERRGFLSIGNVQNTYSEDQLQCFSKRFNSGQKSKNKSSISVLRKAVSHSQIAQNMNKESLRRKERISARSVDQKAIHLRNTGSKEFRLQESEQKPLKLGSAHLAQDINEAIRTEKSLSAVRDEIIVTVEQGIVILKGKVNTKEEKIIAGVAAFAFVDYGRVINYLEIIDE